MSITGEKALAAIQALTDVDVKAESDAIADALAREAQTQMDGLGIGEHSAELFRAYRVAELRGNESKILKEQNSARGNLPVSQVSQLPSFEQFFARVLSWGPVSEEQARELFENHLEKYQSLKKELFRARSLATHVSAVLRPFKLRFFELWKEANVNNLNFEEVREHADKLREEEISDGASLYVWAMKVYRLFVQAAVVGKDYGSWIQGVEESRPRRPLGTISEASEKIYSHQWKNWIIRNEQRLLELDYATIPPLPQDGSYGSKMASRGFPSHTRFNQDAARDMMKSGWRLLQGPSSLVDQRVSISIQSLEDITLRAEWSSLASSQVARDFSEWSRETKAFWGDSARNVRGELIFGTGSSESKHVLPEMSLSKLEQMVSEAIHRRFG